MSFINLGTDLNEVKEPEAVPEAMYDLVINKVMNKEVNGVLTGLNVIIGIEGHMDAADVFHHISLPVDDDDEEKAKFKMRFLKKFVTLFSLPFTADGIDPVDFPGATARGKLGLKEYEGIVSNKIIL